MKIAICTSPLSSASKTRGVGAYTRELIKSLKKYFPSDQVIETVSDPYKTKADLIHYPFFDPFYLTLPWIFTKPTIITIHDLIPLKYPAHFKVGIWGTIKLYIQRSRVRSSSAIITDSEASKRDINKLFLIPNSKIFVVPLSSATSRTVYSLTNKLKKLYHLPDRYILYVGDINWNKNIPGLIDAFARLNNSSTHLVLVGKVFADKPNINEYLDIKNAIEKSGKAELIHQVGYVPSHHLGAIYHAATLYVQPSFDEGFGLPVLEAMKAGTAVLCSNQGSLSEVASDAVSYFDPTCDDLTQAIENLLSSSQKRAELISRGYERAKLFSWKNTATRTHDVYTKIITT